MITAGTLADGRRADMDDRNDDLPRHTWTRNGSVVSIFGRSGPYGQDHLLIVSVPAVQLGTAQGQANDALLPEVANAICEYLDRRDRARQEPRR